MDREDGQITVPRTMRFGASDLRQLRQLTARWAVRAGLPPNLGEILRRCGLWLIGGAW
jgi:hypothetical protein